MATTTATIGYDLHWRQAHGLLTNAVLATELVDAEPAGRNLFSFACRHTGSVLTRLE